jgi:hypothetical protein
VLKPRPGLAALVAFLVLATTASVAAGTTLDFWTGVVSHHQDVIVQVSHVRGDGPATIQVSWQCKTGRHSADDFVFRLAGRIRKGRLRAAGPQPVNSGSGHLTVNLRALRAGHEAHGTLSWRATTISGKRCSGHGTWAGNYVR